MIPFLMLVGAIACATFGWWVRGVLDAFDAEVGPMVPPHVVDRASRHMGRRY